MAWMERMFYGVETDTYGIYGYSRWGLRQGKVIASHRILWDAITFPWLRYMFLVPKISYHPGDTYRIIMLILYHSNQMTIIFIHQDPISNDVHWLEWGNRYELVQLRLEYSDISRSIGAYWCPSSWHQWDISSCDIDKTRWRCYFLPCWLISTTFHILVMM